MVVFQWCTMCKCVNWGRNTSSFKKRIVIIFDILATDSAIQSQQRIFLISSFTPKMADHEILQIRGKSRIFLNRVCSKRDNEQVT